MNEPNGEWPVVECAGFHFYCSNEEEFARICQDVFPGHEYAFDIRGRHPLIIDAGAHIGVATHYFKHRHPQARVLAIEANPVTFSLLRRNVSHNALDDVQLLHAALAPEAGEITFYTGVNGQESSSWGDSAVRQPWHGDESAAAVQVPAITLSSLLTERVDLLKLDIEGLETAVLAEAAPRLAQVRRIVLEFHGTRANPDNDIARLVAILDRAGFTVDVYQFGAIVSLDAIQRDDPFWLIVRAERLSPWRRLRRR